MPKVAMTVPTSPVSLMLSAVRAEMKGPNKLPPITLPDLILTRLRPTRRYEFASAMSSAARLLALGSSYADLVGNPIFPASNKSGPAPKWAGAAEPIKSIVPTPDWTNSTEIVELSMQQQTLGLLATKHQKDNLARVAKMGKANYLATTELLQEVNAKAIEEQTLREDAEARYRAVKEEMRQEMRAIVDQRIAEREGMAA